MEQIKKFLRSRGFTLALLACLVAAAAAGVWAVRTVRDELKKSYDDLTTPQEEPAPEPQLTLDPQEDDVWQQPVTDAAESAANVPSPHPLRPLLGRSLALVWCTNPPHCRAHPRLPAVQLRLPPRSPSRAGS